MDPDLGVGPVPHRGERDDVGVFELAEPCFGVGLGPVAGDDVGDWPVVAVGDQDPFAEQLGLQRFAGGGIDGEGQPHPGGGISGEVGGEYPAQPAGPGDAVDGGLHAGAVAAAVAALEYIGEFV